MIDCDFPAKYDSKNNGIVRRVSEDSDVSTLFLIFGEVNIFKLFLLG